MATITNPLAEVSQAMLAESVELADGHRRGGDLALFTAIRFENLADSALAGVPPRRYELASTLACRSIGTEDRVERWDRVYRGDRPFPAAGRAA